MEDSVVCSPGVRNQHYYFAQKVLYDFIKSDVNYTYYLLFQKEFKEALEDLWKYTNKTYKNAEPEELIIESNGFPISFIELKGNKIILVITLPEPLSMGESYQVGLYFYQNSSKVGFRYFMNEFHDKEHSSFCERKGSTHSFYGTSKTLSEKEFIKRIELAVKKSLN